MKKCSNLQYLHKTVRSTLIQPTLQMFLLLWKRLLRRVRKTRFLTMIRGLFLRLIIHHEPGDNIYSNYLHRSLASRPLFLYFHNNTNSHPRNSIFLHASKYLYGHVIIDWISCSNQFLITYALYKTKQNLIQDAKLAQDRMAPKPEKKSYSYKSLHLIFFCNSEEVAPEREAVPKKNT